VAGKWVDGLGSHKLIFTMLILLAGALLSLPWASANLWSTIVALAIWSGARCPGKLDHESLTSTGG
jgi:hypothetical protein